MKGLSLFAGAGGFDQGARMAGIEVVASIEREAKPVASLTANGFHPIHADVTGVDFTTWAGVDVIFGGPPCQGHSRANSLKVGLERNELAWEMVRAAKETGAAFVLIENVRTFDEQLHAQITGALTRLGYFVGATVLNAADYGVAQDRHRRFILASRGLVGHWPDPTHAGKPKTIDAALTGLTFVPAPCTPTMISKGIDPEWRLVAASNFSNNKIGRFGYETSFTVTGKNFDDTRIRAEDGTYGRLDPHGMARLQSFDDDFVFTGSKNDRALQIGNAVPPILAWRIFQGMK